MYVEPAIYLWRLQKLVRELVLGVEIVRVSRGYEHWNDSDPSTS
jgi:hypothetical protein